MDDGVPGRPRSYYGRPILKAPEWTWEVPWYLFVGGLAGVSSALGFVARLAGDLDLQRRLRLVGAAGSVVGPALLISDLGRPRRFLNMLRVFKPTSAMSVGSWILAVYSASVTSATGLSLLGRWPRMVGALDGAAAAFGLPLAVYTAVLVADTSVPVWHEARTELPFVFAASAAASAGAAAVLLTPPAHPGPGRRLAIGAVAVELVAEAVMRRRLGELGEVYEVGDAARWHRAAQLSSAGGALLLAVAGRRRAVAATGAACILAGSVSQRWAVYRAGFASVADPKYVVGPQRRRMEERS